MGVNRSVQLKLLHPGGRGFIVVDGVDMSNAVNGVDIKSRVGHATTVSLSIPVPVVEYDGESKVCISEATHAALVALGWTPPSSEDP